MFTKNIIQFIIQYTTSYYWILQFTEILQYGILVISTEINNLDSYDLVCIKKNLTGVKK